MLAKSQTWVVGKDDVGRFSPPCYFSSHTHTHTTPALNVSPFAITWWCVPISRGVVATSSPSSLTYFSSLLEPARRHPRCASTIFVASIGLRNAYALDTTYYVKIRPAEMCFYEAAEWCMHTMCSMQALQNSAQPHHMSSETSHGTASMSLSSLPKKLNLTSCNAPHPSNRQIGMFSAVGEEPSEHPQLKIALLQRMLEDFERSWHFASTALEPTSDMLECQEVLGSGTYGTVASAWCGALGKRFAVKIPSSEVSVLPGVSEQPRVKYNSCKSASHNTHTRPVLHCRADNPANTASTPMFYT